MGMARAAFEKSVEQAIQGVNDATQKRIDSARTDGNKKLGGRPE
jgi:hypothetical protein